MHVTYRDYATKDLIMVCGKGATVPRKGEFVSLFPNPVEWEVSKVVYTYESFSTSNNNKVLKAIDVYIITSTLGF